MSHPVLAQKFTDDRSRAQWHDRALWFVREKRDRMAASVPEWEELRQHAAAIKEHTMSRLPDYLELFEKNATALGAQIHWAGDGAEHNRIVLEILQRHKRQETGQEQIDAHGRMSPESIPGRQRN